MYVLSFVWLTAFPVSGYSSLLSRLDASFLERAHLPGESLLIELNCAVVLAVAHSQADLVAEGTRSANHDTHGTNLVLHLGADEVLNVGTAWEHLHGGRRRMDLLGGSWP